MRTKLQIATLFLALCYTSTFAQNAKFKEITYVEIEESDQEFLEHQDSHAKKLESIDMELLVKDAKEILHIDSVKLKRKNIEVTFEDAWFREAGYFDNGSRHSEWLYNMNIKGVKDSIKIFVGHYENYFGEAEFQVSKYPHLYESVEDFMTKKNKYMIGNSLTKHVAKELGGGFQGSAILHESYVAHESITTVEKKFLKSKRTKFLESIVIYVLDGEHVLVSIFKGKNSEMENIKIDAEHVFTRHHFARIENQK